MRKRWVVLAVLPALGLGACGSDDGPRLKRADVPRWCPSTFFALDGRPGHHGSLDANALVGLELPMAREVAARHGCTVRVVEGDGGDHFLTMDLRSDRINVAVHDGLVTALDERHDPVG